MNNIVITRDIAAKKLNVTRQFNAPLQKVWQAWTQADVLDQWWAPKPWKAQTKTFEFTPGGLWLYAMVSPEGETHWSRVEFKTIDVPKGFTYFCVFSDENGTPNADTPGMHWNIKFIPTETGTTLQVELSFSEEASMQKMIQMGFEGGFTMGLNNLEELLGA